MAVNEFSGEYRFTLDTKKRMNIPAGIRKMLPPEADGTLVFTRGFEGCVFVYSNDEWKRLTRMLNSLNNFDAHVRNFVRVFVGSAHKAVMDSQGRILLPDKVLQMAQIEREVLLLGTINKFELWNPQVYEEFVQSNNLNMESLAEKVNFSALFNSSDLT